MRVTRLAPSPTGALHLGNARTFLINWILARRNGWKIILRIEDIDGPRIKKGADEAAIEDLRWLGIDWDEGPVYQTARLPQYRAAMDDLLARGLAYPCICSRKEVELAASAPHAEDGAAVYPGTCRGRFGSVQEAAGAAGRPPAIRFRVPEGRVGFTDELLGGLQYDAAGQLGDFVIAKVDGTPAYQIAVVVDDREMGVTDIVRGDDLLDSTPRQILLYRALGWESSIPRYWHLPLVVGKDGRRLAKRHGDTRLAHYREMGVPASRVVALLGRWCGVNMGQEATARGMLERFEGVAAERIVFTEEDEAFLRGTPGTASAAANDSASRTDSRPQPRLSLEGPRSSQGDSLGCGATPGARSTPAAAAEAVPGTTPTGPEGTP